MNVKMLCCTINLRKGNDRNTQLNPNIKLFLKKIYSNQQLFNRKVKKKKIETRRFHSYPYKK